MTFTVEKCTASDANSVFEIEKSYIECYWTKENIVGAIESNGYSFFKATYGKEMLGYGGVQWCEPEGNICNVAVKENARRKGIATEILLAIEKEGKVRGVQVLFLEVNEKNAGAISLYEKHGFIKMGTRPRYYGNDGAVTMKKDI